MLKVSQDEIAKVLKMPVKILLRKSLKLLKTYPSMNRDALKRDIVLDYKDGAKLRNRDEFDRALEMGRKFLVHLMGHELIRRELLSDNLGTLNIDVTTQVPLDKKKVKKMEETLKNAEEKYSKYEFF
jgi:hypothetical protein